LKKIKNHIVSTKVLNGELVQALELAGLELTQHDFIEQVIEFPENIYHVKFDPIIVLTSQTAVIAWSELVHWLNLNDSHFSIYCLEGATQKLALKNKFNVVGVAADSASLADKILENKSIKEITFICGNLRRDELPNKLKDKDVQVSEFVAYKTELTPIKIESHYDGIIFLSPSGVDSFLSKNSLTKATAFCIGQTTATHAVEKGFVEVKIANTPSQESLVKSVIEYYKSQTVHA
jgi:uroporphyrinogen-III synthase